MAQHLPVEHVTSDVSGGSTPHQSFHLLSQQKFA